MSLTTSAIIKSPWVAGIIIYILLVVGVWAQTAEPKTATPVGMSEPVITIHGACDDRPTIPAAEITSCNTVVTRETFERLINSMNVAGKTLMPETRRNLAETYAQYLALERPAAKTGLESTPQFTEIMRWWRLRTLADMYRGNLQEQFKNPSPGEIHAYYMEHLSSYERIQVERVLIPRSRGTTEEAKRSDEKALDTAKEARERMAKGDNPELVQKDAYAALGITSFSPAALGSLGRSAFPPEQSEELFSLNPGQISKVETEAASFVTYKLISKATLPEDGLKEEISRSIALRKFTDALRSINESAKPEINDAYFGPTGTPPTVYSGPLASPHP
jgi:hypothetical protein